jgi:hypothetical protein
MDDETAMKIDAIERQIDARLLRFWERLAEVAEVAEVNGVAFGAVMDALVAHKNDAGTHFS